MTAQNAGVIQYTVTADVAGFVNGMSGVPGTLDRAGGAMDRTDKQAAKLDSGLSALKKSFAALGVAATLKSAVGIIDSFKAMNEQVRMNTASTGEFIAVQERLKATADGTYRSLAEAQGLYVSTADALRALGFSTNQVVDINDSLSYALVRNAASTQKADAAINAYTKSIQIGRVGALAWTSIIAAAPTIIDDIAAATGKSSNEIRKLGATGKLSAEQLNSGLLSSLKGNKEAADAMAVSTKDAFMQLTNNVGTALVALDDQLGATQALVSGIKMASDVVKNFGNDNEQMANFLTLASTAAASTAAVIAGRLVGSLAAYSAQQYRNIAAALGTVSAEKAAAAAALNRAQASLSAARGSEAELSMLVALNPLLAESSGLNHALAQASARVAAAQLAVASAMQQTATVTTYTAIAMRGLNTAMTFLGGPLGVIMIAAAALYYFANAATQTKVNVDELNGSLKRMTFNQLQRAYNDAGDDIEKLQKRLQRVQNQFNRVDAPIWENEEDIKKRQQARLGEIDDIKKEIEERKNLQAAAKEQQDQIEKDADAMSKNGGKPVHRMSNADQAVLDALEDERRLASLAGEARARLAAEQKLSADATDEEKKRVGDLAVEIYRLDEAKKNLKKTDSQGAKDAKKNADEAKRNAEQNTKAIEDYAVSIGMAAMKGEDLIRAQAQSKLNKFATKEDVETMDRLAKAMYKVQQVEENKVKLASVSDGASESQRYAEEMKKIQELRDADLISNQQYMDLKFAAEKGHDEKLMAVQEAAFIRQGEANAFLMSSIDALGSATTSVFTGILSGTMNAQQAMQAFSSAILNEAIGSLVKMGVQAIKTMVIQKSASAAAAAAYVGGVSAQVATTTALAAQAAFASTAAIPVTGPAAAPGAAIAASSAAAALGAPAIASAAGVAGGRLYGGPVAGGSMYKVNEDGSPELFQAANGDQFMLPGTNGEVISNKNASGGGGMMVNIEINVDSGGGSSSNVSGGGGSDELAEKFRAMTLTIMQEEAQQGGILWNMQNDRY